MSSIVVPSAATPETVKRLLDQGHKLYPKVGGYEMLVYRDEKTGKYVYQHYQDLYEFEGTLEGIHMLACWITFGEVTYV